MLVKIQILSDDGKVLVEQIGTTTGPVEWSSPYPRVAACDLGGTNKLYEFCWLPYIPDYVRSLSGP